MAIPGSKTGADAISKDISHICSVVQAYGPKFAILVAAAVTAGIIDSAEGATINGALSAVVGACTLFQKLADFNSVS